MSRATLTSFVLIAIILISGIVWWFYISHQESTIDLLTGFVSRDHGTTVSPELTTTSSTTLSATTTMETTVNTTTATTTL